MFILLTYDNQIYLCLSKSYLSMNESMKGLLMNSNYIVYKYYVYMQIKNVSLHVLE